MEKEISKSKRRIGLLINFTSIISFIVVFEILKKSGPGVYLFIIESVLAGVAIVSFVYVFVKTGLWKITHTRFEKLDEREIQIFTNSLRYSYSIFVITTLVIIYTYALVAQGPIDVVIAAGLLYIAHTLPAAILAWTAKTI